MSAKNKILTLLTQFVFMKEEFDFESIKNKAIEQLKAGKLLLGKDGAFAPLLESILNAYSGAYPFTFRQSIRA